MLWIKRKLAVSIAAAVFFTACTAERTSAPAPKVKVAPEAININTAGVGDLRRIPNIGEKLALKIVEFREKHGPLRRPEHLLLIDGVSDRRFREVRHLVRVE